MTGLLSVSLLIISVIANDDAFFKEKTADFSAQWSRRAQWGKHSVFTLNHLLAAMSRDFQVLLGLPCNAVGPACSLPDLEKCRRMFTKVKWLVYGIYVHFYFIITKLRPLSYLHHCKHLHTHLSPLDGYSRNFWTCNSEDAPCRHWR